MVKSNDELFKAMSKTLQASFKLSIQKYQLFPAENDRVIFYLIWNLLLYTILNTRVNR